MAENEVEDQKDAGTPVSLEDFLIENPIQDLTNEIYPSNRFRKNGLAFTIHVADSDRLSDLRRQCTRTNRRGAQTFDGMRFNELLALEFTTQPNFKSADAVKRAGVMTPEQYMKKVLLPGEITEIANQVTELSGFDLDDSDLVDQAKN